MDTIIILPFYTSLLLMILILQGTHFRTDFETIANIGSRALITKTRGEVGNLDDFRRRVILELHG